MDPEVADIEWNSLPPSIRKKKWSKLSEKERALAWKKANDDEKQAIADITSIDLNRLSARARRLPDSFDSISESNSDSENIDDNIKFELKRIHRKRVETELEAIREAFSEYTELNEERSRKRRSENIYILVALGIIGGYLTYNPDLALDSIYQVIGLAFTVASAIFVLIKVITVRMADIPSNTNWNKFDNIVDGGFAVVITGVFAFGSLGAIVSIFNLQTVGIIQPITIILPLIAMVIQMMKLSEIFSETQTKSADELYDEIIEELFHLPESSNINDDAKQIIDLVKKFSEAGAITSQIQDIQDKVSKIEGIPNQEQNYMEGKIEEIIEEKEKAEKSEEELRAEKIADLEEQREEYHEEIRERY